MTAPAAVDVVPPSSTPPTPVPTRSRRGVARTIVAALVIASVGVGWWAAGVSSTAREAAERADRRRVAIELDSRRLHDRRLATRRIVGALTEVLGARTSDRDALAVSLIESNGRLVDMRHDLLTATAGLQALDARIGSLRGCLFGVSGALNALAVGDAGTALARLRAVAPQCEASS